jgi:hypothetical protein
LQFSVLYKWKYLLFILTSKYEIEKNLQKRLFKAKTTIYEKLNAAGRNQRIKE